MAWPGEQENVEYMNYKMQIESDGQQALPKDQWRLQRQQQMQQPQPEQPQVSPEALSMITNALMRRM